MRKFFKLLRDFAFQVVEQMVHLIGDNTNELKSRIVYGAILGFFALLIVISGGAMFDVFVTLLVVLAIQEYATIASQNPKVEGFNLSIFLHRKYQMFFKIKYGYYLIFSIGVMMIMLRSSIAGLEKILYIAMLVSSMDTAAYFGGKKFGSKKFCPHISPGKTWEGLLFGMIGAFLFSVLFYYLFSWRMQFMFYLMFSLVLAVLSQVGDLMESHFKRTFGVKHSGNILKGHGGILDRFDGYILTVPTFFLTDTILFLMNINYC